MLAAEPVCIPSKNDIGCTNLPTPPPVLTRASLWFKGQKCGKTGSPCLDKPALQRGMYHGTHFADTNHPYP